MKAIRPHFLYEVTLVFGRTAAQSLLCTALQEAASASVPEHFGRWVQDVFSHSLAMYWELELSGESRTEEGEGHAVTA